MMMMAEEGVAWRPFSLPSAARRLRLSPSNSGSRQSVRHFWRMENMKRDEKMKPALRLIQMTLFFSCDAVFNHALKYWGGRGGGTSLRGSWAQRNPTAGLETHGVHSSGSFPSFTPKYPDSGMCIGLQPRWISLDNIYLYSISSSQKATACKMQRCRRELRCRILTFRAWMHRREEFTSHLFFIFNAIKSQI